MKNFIDLGSRRYLNKAHTISLGLREVGKLYMLRICVLMCAKIRSLNRIQA